MTSKKEKIVKKERVGRQKSGSSASNISDTKNAEKKISSIIKNIYSIYNGIVLTDLKGIVIYANKFSQKLYGYTAKEMLGLRTIELAFHSKQALEIKQAIKTTGIWSGEMSCKKKNGEPHPILLSASLIYDDTGKAIAMIGLSQDISSQKNTKKALIGSEEKYKALYQSSRDAIMTLTPEGQFTAGNQATVEIFNCRDEKDFISNTPPDLSPQKQPDGRLSTEKAMEMINTATKKGAHFFEWMHKRSNGENFPATVLLTRVEIEGKTMLQATVRDITEQKKYEKALKDSKHLIEQEVTKQTKKINKLNQELQKYAKKLDLKVKRIDEKRVPLTDKEKLAFWGFVRYPELNSTAVSKKIKLPATTVNAINKRLKKEGYFKTMYIPRFDLLGANLFSVDFISQSLEESNDMRMPEIRKKILEKFSPTPEIVYLNTSDRSGLALRISKNWESTMEFYSAVAEEARGMKISHQLLNSVHFNMSSSSLPKFFDFSRIIKQQFELNEPEDSTNKSIPDQHIPSTTEKKMICGLVNYPEYGVAKLSKAIGISVPTICKLRKKLLQEGLLNKVNFPDFSKIGMELLVLHHYKIKKTSRYYKKKINCINSNVFFTISNKSDHITMALYKNYSEIESTIDSCKSCNINDLEQKPDRIIIPLEKIEFSKLNFTPLVNKIFGTDNKARHRSLKKHKTIKNPDPRLHTLE